MIEEIVRAKALRRKEKIAVLEKTQQQRLPVLVVQGSRDAFGVPPGAAVVPGADHGFRVLKGVDPAGPQVQALVRDWLSGMGPPRCATP